MGDLVLRAELRVEVENVIEHCGPRFIALHIRRTDHHAYEIGEHTPDEAFERFADSFPDHFIYLATDNAATQRRFRERYRERLRLYDLIDPTLCWRTTLRLTPLRAAVIDLFVCAAAEAFKGSSYSSFSDTIKHLRTNRGTSAARPDLDEHEMMEPHIDMPDFEERRLKRGAGAFRRQGGLRLRDEQHGSRSESPTRGG